jgi:glycosyltransferase involved in cell wall biosynthesis
MSSNDEPGGDRGWRGASEGMPRVLAIVTFFPWPANHGDAVRRLMLLDSLASSTELTAICIERPETVPQDVAELNRRLGDSRLIAVPPWQRKHRPLFARLGRVLRGLVTGNPPWVFRQWSPGVSSVLTALRVEDFDTVLLIGEPAGLFASPHDAQRVIWDKSNVLTASDLDALSSVSSPVGKLRALTGIPFSYLFERRVLRHVDDVWVTSAEEAGRLRRTLGREASLVLPSAVHPGAVADGLDHGSKTLLWLSTFSYTPNWDGLVRFLEAADGKLRSGGFTLRLVGAGATDRQVDFLREFPYVDYRGYVDELADACHGVAFGVVPVWAGAGVKLKTLTLMGLGVPIVATPVALEGIGLDAAAVVAQTPADFAAALTSLTPGLLAAAAARGRQTLSERFSEDQFAAAVASAVSNHGVGH